MKKWSKQIHWGRLHILLSNHFRLGFSLRKSWWALLHLNLWTCQIQIDKKPDCILCGKNCKHGFLTHEDARKYNLKITHDNSQRDRRRVFTNNF